MKFRSYVEPPEPMRGLEVPPEVVEALGGGKRPAVIITINGHSWKSRVAIMSGRYLLGLSIANRKAAGIATGDEVEVEVEIDAEPRVVAEPADFTRALDADPVARTAYDRLSYSRKREHVLAIESAKKTETRTADREGPGHAAGPGAGRGPCGARQDSRRSPLTSSKGGPRLPWRETNTAHGPVRRSLGSQRNWVTQRAQA